MLLPKDFVRLRLTGEHAVDRADGSGTMLFDLAARDWSTEIVDELGIQPAWLPPTYEGPSVTGTITEAAASATGLRAGTPVIAGGGDQAAAAVGVGSVVPGVSSLSLGTSGVLFTTTEGPAIEPEGRLHAFCHALPDRWHLMGVMLSAAGSLRWYRDALAPGVAFEELVEEAASVPAGSDGLLFLPYLTGERTPYADPLARGAFVGLTVHHGRAHLTRAVLEGVAFGLRDSLELMRAAGVPHREPDQGDGRGEPERPVATDPRRRAGRGDRDDLQRRGRRAGRRDPRRRGGRVVRHGAGRVYEARADRRAHRALGRARTPTPPRTRGTATSTRRSPRPSTRTG